MKIRRLVYELNPELLKKSVFSQNAKTVSYD